MLKKECTMRRIALCLPDGSTEDRYGSGLRSHGARVADDSGISSSAKHTKTAIAECRSFDGA